MYPIGGASFDTEHYMCYYCAGLKIEDDFHMVEESTVGEFIAAAVAVAEEFASTEPGIKWCPLREIRTALTCSVPYLCVGVLRKGSEEIPINLQKDPFVADPDKYSDYVVRYPEGMIFGLSASLGESTRRENGRDITTFVAALRDALKRKL